MVLATKEVVTQRQMKERWEHQQKDQRTGISRDKSLEERTCPFHWGPVLSHLCPLSIAPFVGSHVGSSQFIPRVSISLKRAHRKFPFPRISAAFSRRLQLARGQVVTIHS